MKMFYLRLSSLLFLQQLSGSKFASATFLLVCFLSLKESTCETSKNVFYVPSETFSSPKNQILEF